MVTTKHCSYGNCNSDSRYYHKPHMQGIEFFKFPNKKWFREKCLRWVHACRRVGFTIDNIRYNNFICSRHFHGGKPTAEHPDPIATTASKSVLCPSGMICTSCSRHFHGEIGPTPEHPDPVSATASEVQVQKYTEGIRKLRKAEVMSTVGQKKASENCRRLDVAQSSRNSKQRCELPNFKLIVEDDYVPQEITTTSFKKPKIYHQACNLPDSPLTFGDDGTAESSWQVFVLHT